MVLYSTTEQILETLKKAKKPLTKHELARLTGLSYCTVSSCVNLLEAKGMIKVKRIMRKDGRARRCLITI